MQVYKLELTLHVCISVCVRIRSLCVEAMITSVSRTFSRGCSQSSHKLLFFNTPTNQTTAFNRVMHNVLYSVQFPLLVKKLIICHCVRLLLCICVLLHI